MHIILFRDLFLFLVIHKYRAPALTAWGFPTSNTYLYIIPSLGVRRKAVTAEEKHINANIRAVAVHNLCARGTFINTEMASAPSLPPPSPPPPPNPAPTACLLQCGGQPLENLFILFQSKSFIKSALWDWFMQQRQSRFR